MAPAILAALSLAKHVPDILNLFGKPNAAEAAEKVVGIAQAITGTGSADDAVRAIAQSPELALQLQKEVMAHKERLEEIAARREAADAEADNRADELLTQRIALLEGTASDLKALPYLGSFMLLLRGMQRLIISYGTAYADWIWLTGGFGEIGELQQRLLFSASMLVFVVLFGERAIKNVAPLVIELMNTKKQG